MLGLSGAMAELINMLKYINKNPSAPQSPLKFLIGGWGAQKAQNTPKFDFDPQNSFFFLSISLFASNTKLRGVWGADEIL